MDTAVAVKPPAPELFEQVLIKGDLSKLTAQERASYYMKVCNEIGINPYTWPFQYLVLSGKLVLYATKNCTDQLRMKYDVSVVELIESFRDNVFIVTAKVTMPNGRTDMAKGAVTIGGLKGDALANMLMKAETKAKRRATLSLCGLSALDETELDTIPTEAKGNVVPVELPPAKVAVQEAPPNETPTMAIADHDPETGEVYDDTPRELPLGVDQDGEPDWMKWCEDFVGAINRCKTLEEVTAWLKATKRLRDRLVKDNKTMSDMLDGSIAGTWAKVKRDEKSAPA